VGTADEPAEFSSFVGRNASRSRSSSGERSRQSLKRTLALSEDLSLDLDVIGHSSLASVRAW